MIFYSLGFNSGSAFTALFSIGLSPTSYLARLYIKCYNSFSFLHTSLCGVPRGSLLFIMYTTPLSTLISSLSLYHLYTDDTSLEVQITNMTNLRLCTRPMYNSTTTPPGGRAPPSSGSRAPREGRGVIDRWD